MDFFDRETQDGSIEKILKSLREINNMLIKANRANGNLKRYNAMKREIEQAGWNGICEKYHSDINTSDPAAFELYEYYKYIYSGMDHRSL